MKVSKKTKKDLAGLISPKPENKINSEADFEPEEILEKATDSVIQDLPERKRKAYERKNWGDRPEHLRKPIGQMTLEEKSEYYKWKAGDFKEAEEIPQTYAESEIYALGCVLLPILCARMPNPLPPTSDELQGFGRVMTPVANKYVSAFAYKEEFNAALFLIAFAIPRVKAANNFVPEVNSIEG